MKDRQPKPVWDTAPLSDSFGTPFEPVRDVAFGDGQRFTVGVTGTISVEVFPAAGVTRVQTPDERIEMHRSPAPRRVRSGVVFERPGTDTFLLIQRDGTVGFMNKPVMPLETAVVPADESRDVNEGMTLPDTADAASGHPGVSGTPSEQEKQERVTIKGRVGKIPRFRTTGKGRLC